MSNRSKRADDGEGARCAFAHPTPAGLLGVADPDCRFVIQLNDVRSPASRSRRREVSDARPVQTGLSPTIVQRRITRVCRASSKPVAR